ncbi:hypothetical protein PBI_INDLOVU_47 [Mycobacterium phage Indlovu]|nr:hypothetical protein PBI_INDLOVU_47 [Mycobacterium phage Indlovu]
MAGSPFNKGGAAATAPAAKAEAKKDDLPDATNLGEDKPISKGDPFAAADPAGISGFKMQYFLGQLILVHPTEHGSMKTSTNNSDKPESEFVRVDIIPLTVPEPGQPTSQTSADIGDGQFAIINKDGDVEPFDAYEVGERLDDVLAFQQALVREFKKALDNGTAWLLGRLVKGNKKPGQSAPYILVAGSDEDKALYQEWRNKAAAAK